jgi:ComF family protein
MFTSLTDSLLSLVYPQSCVICGFSVEERSNGVACKNCWSQTRVFTGSETLCSKCGAYLRDKSSGAKHAFCHDCDSQVFDAAHALGVYEKALAAVIVNLKKNPHMPATLREHIRSAINRIELARNTLIIPVPLSAKRKLERGFNQAEVIAACLASETGFSVNAGVLERTVHTTIHRVAMDKKAREMSVAKAFRLQPEKVVGRDILLVDDVFTSGSTVSACAAILKKGGAKTVRVFTLGRAVLR